MTLNLKWPLLSRRNLAISGAVLLLILLLIGKVTGSTSVAATPTPAATSTAAATPDAPTYTPEAPTTAEAYKPNPRWSSTQTATLFVQAWARPHLAQAEWLAGVEPYATPALAKALATTDPARVPATRIVGDPTMLKIGPGWVWVQFATDAGDIVVSLSSVDEADFHQRWSVANIQPADQPPTTAPGKADR